MFGTCADSLGRSCGTSLTYGWLPGECPVLWMFAGAVGGPAFRFPDSAGS